MILDTRNTLNRSSSAADLYGHPNVGRASLAMAIIQSGTAFQFKTEADLEELVWRSLPALLNLQPLSRQFAIDGKFCDILAVENLNRLAIIELKNTEDRYIIQQLTRYYDAIKAAKDFPFEVDTSQPI
jgi:RecB family endonuclease NucS